MAQRSADALAEGLADGLGFLGGALAGWQLGRLLGLDVLAPGQFTWQSVAAWVLLLAGCGAGKWASLRWRARRQRNASTTK